MADENPKRISAVSLSRLSKAFDERLESRTADLEEALVERDRVLSRIEARVDAALVDAEERAQLLAEIDLMRGELAQAEARNTALFTNTEAIGEQRDAAMHERDRLLLEVARMQERLVAAAAETESRIGACEQRDSAMQERDRLLLEVARMQERLATAATETEKRIAALGDALERREAQAEALKRTARAREAWLRDEAEEARLQGQLALAGANALVDRKAEQLALLATAVQQRSPDGVTSLLSALLSHEGPAIPKSPPLEPVVEWLARHGEAGVRGKPSLRFEVDAALSSTDEQFVAAAYLWLLGRPVDAAGETHYCTHLHTGMTRAGLLTDLASSQEAKARLNEGTAVRGSSDKKFIASAYASLLDRGADTAGLIHYLALLQAGGSRGKMLLDLARSQEARESCSVLGAALRTISWINSAPGQAHRLLTAFSPQRRSESRKSWHAGRLAAIETRFSVAHSQHESALETLLEQTKQRVAAARATGVELALDQRRVAALGSGITAPTTTRENLLDDFSHDRTVEGIMSLIEGELQELGLR